MLILRIFFCKKLITKIKITLKKKIKKMNEKNDANRRNYNRKNKIDILDI